MYDNLEHYHTSDRFPTRDSLLWSWSLERAITVTDDHTVGDNEDIIVCDFSTLKTVTLPLARNGRYCAIIKTGSGNVTVAASGSETVNGSASITISTSYAGVRFKALDQQWIQI